MDELPLPELDEDDDERTGLPPAPGMPPVDPFDPLQTPPASAGLPPPSAGLPPLAGDPLAPALPSAPKPAPPTPDPFGDLEGLAPPGRPPSPHLPQPTADPLGARGDFGVRSGDLLAPVDDLVGLALETDEGETFAVYLLGFTRGRQEAPGKMAELFGLDPLTAESLVASAPVAVKRGASRTTAQQMERVLRSIGADVDVRPEAEPKPRGRQPDPGATSMDKAREAIASQNAAAAHSLPPGTVQAMASVSPRAARAISPELAHAAQQEHAVADDHPGFWARLPIAFLVPFLGTGALWLIGLTFVLFGVGFTRLAPCFGLFLMPVAAAFYLGLLGTYFGQAAQAGLEDEGDGLPRPRWALPERHDVLTRGGVLVLLTLLLFGIPASLALGGRSPVVVYLVGLLPYVYWPMALTVVGLTGSLLSLFNPLHVVRGIMAGGLPYAVVVVVGFLLYAGLSALPLLLIALGPLAGLLGAIALVAGVGYVAGVQGYLMGCIVASRTEKFEGLIL